jgi:hypothetical protein
LSLQVGAQAGTFELVATNSSGNSSLIASSRNRFTVVDPRSNADTSGNGVPDVIKASFCLDLFDPNSIPAILPVPEVDSLTVSLLNGVAPAHLSPAVVEADGLTVSLLNGTSPVPLTQTVMEADGLTVSLLNGIRPGGSSSSSFETDSLTASVLNGTSPSAQPTIFEVDGLTVSLFNSAPKTGKEQHNRTIFATALSQGQKKMQRGSDFRKRSSTKPKVGRRAPSNEGE